MDQISLITILSIAIVYFLLDHIILKILWIMSTKL